MNELVNEMTVNQLELEANNRHIQQVEVIKNSIQQEKEFILQQFTIQNTMLDRRLNSELDRLKLQHENELLRIRNNLRTFPES